MCMYIYLNHFTVYLKLTHYKFTIFQVLKKKELPNSGMQAGIWAENRLSFTSNILRKHVNLNVF